MHIEIDGSIFDLQYWVFISFAIKMEGDYQILNLVQMMDQISLEQFSSKILSGKPSEMISQEIETSSSNSEGFDIPQMRTPQHIYDYHKLSWMIKDNTSVEHLMTATFQGMDQCLNHYFGVINQRVSPMSFVQVYPHSYHLKANRFIRKDELVVQVGQEWFLNRKVYSKTRIARYLRKLARHIQQKEGIYEYQTDRDRIRNAVSFCLQFEEVFYIFQLKFVVDICNAAFPRTIYQQAQWLYFHLLPTTYDQMPIKHIETIQKYHPCLAKSFRCQVSSTEAIFSMLKELVNGIGIKKQYQFRNFIQHQQINGQLFYERYQQMTTLENIMWACCCERTRIYQKQEGYHKQTRKTCAEEMYIPILDLFHHSSVKPNIRWDYDYHCKRLRVFASRDIQYGNLLSTCYGSFSIQSEFNYFGVVDIDSECVVSIPFLGEKYLFIKIIERNLQRLPVKDHMLQIVERFYQQPISLNFSTTEYQTLSIQDFWGRLTIQTTKELAIIAHQVYQKGLKLQTQKQFYKKKSKQNSRQRQKQIQKFRRKLAQSSDLMKYVHMTIKKSIDKGIQKKNEKIKQISYELQKHLPFNVEYNLMCLHTILHKEKNLLEAFKDSIYSIKHAVEIITLRST